MVPPMANAPKVAETATKRWGTPLALGQHAVRRLQRAGLAPVGPKGRGADLWPEHLVAFLIAAAAAPVEPVTDAPKTAARYAALELEAAKATRGRRTRAEGRIVGLIERVDPRRRNALAAAAGLPRPFSLGRGGAWPAATFGPSLQAVVWALADPDGGDDLRRRMRAGGFRVALTFGREPRASIAWTEGRTAFRHDFAPGPRTPNLPNLPFPRGALASGPSGFEVQVGVDYDKLEVLADLWREAILRRPPSPRPRAKASRVRTTRKRRARRGAAG
jgi:hypothetical protein